MCKLCRIFASFARNASRGPLVLCGLLMMPVQSSANELRQVATYSVAKYGRYAPTKAPSAFAFIAQLPGESQESRGLVWLDNHRVMFVGIEPGKEETRGLHVWDVNAETVTHYSNHNEFCYANDYIYAVRVPEPPDNVSDRPIRYGQLGNERNEVCNPASERGCKSLLNMSCKPREFVNKALPGAHSEVVLQLRSNDGVLVSLAAKPERVAQAALDNWINQQTKTSIVLLNKRNPKGIPIGISPVEDITQSRASYSEYATSYVLVPRRPADADPNRSGNWPKDRAQVVYLMAQSGLVTKIQVPNLPEWGEIMQAMPANPGLVFQGSGGYANNWGGLFLFDRNVVSVLDRGKVETIAVSPDGCKVAYAIVNDYGVTKVNWYSVKLVRLCKGDA